MTPVLHIYNVHSQWNLSWKTSVLWEHINVSVCNTSQVTCFPQVMHVFLPLYLVNLYHTAGHCFHMLFFFFKITVQIWNWLVCYYCQICIRNSWTFNCFVYFQQVWLFSWLFLLFTETMSTFLFQSQRNWLSHHVLQTYMNKEKLFPKNTLRLKRRILSWILMILVINSITLTSNHQNFPFIHLKILTTVTISCKLLQYMNETNIGTFQCICKEKIYW